MPQLPSPADIVRQTADTASRLAKAARLRGDTYFAAALERRAAEAEQHADHLADIARIHAAPGGLLELQLIADHEAAVRALEEG